MGQTDRPHGRRPMSDKLGLSGRSLADLHIDDLLEVTSLEQGNEGSGCPVNTAHIGRNDRLEILPVRLLSGGHTTIRWTYILVIPPAVTGKIPALLTSTSNPFPFKDFSTWTAAFLISFSWVTSMAIASTRPLDSETSCFRSSV